MTNKIGACVAVPAVLDGVDNFCLCYYTDISTLRQIQEHLKVSLKRQGNDAQIVVSDDGRGLPVDFDIT